MAEPPSDRRHAHSADKVEPRPTEEGLSRHTHRKTCISIQVHCKNIKFFQLENLTTLP